MPREQPVRRKDLVVSLRGVEHHLHHTFDMAVGTLGRPGPDVPNGTWASLKVHACWSTFTAFLAAITGLFTARLAQVYGFVAKLVLKASAQAVQLQLREAARLRLATALRV